MHLRECHFYLLALAALIGCVDDDSQSAVAQSAITDGALDDADPAVVAILTEGNLCTGTLISPWVVLTAAHCVAPAEKMEILFGNDIHAPSARRRVTGAIRHPSFDPTTYANDIAVLVAGARAPDSAVPVKSIATTLDPALASVRIVGFGLNGKSLGLKRQGVARVTSVGDSTFRLVRGPSQTCRGDSGGPAFATVLGVEYLVGVTSVGDESCVSYGEETRVDRHLDAFVTPWIARAEAAVGLGERCFHDESCRDGVCFFPEDAGSIGYCAPKCSDDSGCPQGMSCGPSDICSLPHPSPGAIASACDVDADCDAVPCAHRPGAMHGSCAEACYLNAIPCREGFECAATVHADSYACFPEPPRISATGGGCVFTGRGGGDRGTWVAALALAVVARRAPRRARSRRR